MILSFKAVAEGTRIPRGYGIAWLRFDKYEVVCAPIPLNLMLRISQRLYYRLVRSIRPSKIEKQIQLAYRQGEAQSSKAAYQRGEEVGFKKGADFIAEQVSRIFKLKEGEE